MSVSIIVATPDVGEADAEIEVMWSLGPDIPYTVQENDEIRMLSQDGSVCSKRPVWTSSNPGRLMIMAPSKPGSYVLCLYDNAAKRRILGVPYRIAGAVQSHRRLLALFTEECCTQDEVKVSWSEVSGGYLMITRMDVGENLGMSSFVIDPFEIAVDKQAYFVKQNDVAVLAPKDPGTYQLRYVKKAKCGILTTIGVSNPLVVKPCPFVRSTFEIRGQIKISSTASTLHAGDMVTVTWEVETGAHLLSSLDTIQFHCYGRREEARQPQSIFNVVGFQLAKGSCEVMCPVVPGVFDVAYYAFNTQRCEFYGHNIVVEECPCKLSAQTEKAQAGQAFEVLWEISIQKYSHQDKIVVFDDSGNVHDVFPIGKVKQNRAYGTGRTNILLNYNGKYGLWYYSSYLGRLIARMDSHVTIEGLAAQAPHCDIRVCNDIGVDAEIEVMYEIVGEDLRPAELKKYDLLALYTKESRVRTVCHEVDDPRSYPWLQVQYLKGETMGSVTFRGISDPGSYEIRFLAASRHAYSRICMSASSFTVTLEPPDDQIGFKITSLPLGSFAQCTHNFQESTSFVSFEALRTMSVHDTSIPANAAMNSTSRVQLGQSSSKVFSHSHSSYGSSRVFMPPVQAILHFNTSTEFIGAVIPPKTVSSNSGPVIVTYHILEGLPRENDKIVLVDVDCTKIHSETSLQNSIGRADLTLGSVALRPPHKPGKYLAGFFSEKHRSIVLVSKPFLVNDLDDEGVGLGESHQVSRSNEGETSFGVKKQITTTRNARTRALLIGCSYAQQSFELKGPFNDVRTFQETFVQHGQIHEEEIRVLHDFQSDSSLTPTAINIRNSLKWLLDGLQPKDRIYLHYSGYGTRMSHMDGDSTFDNALVPIDFDWADRMITFSELRTTFFDKIPSGAACMVTLDCAYVPNAYEVARQHNIVDATDTSQKGIAMLAKQRQTFGQDVHALSRAMVPPRGMFPSISPVSPPTAGVPNLGALSHSSYFFVPYSSMAMPSHTAGFRKGIFILQATRETHSVHPQNAWDVYLSHAGGTCGLLSWALNSILKEAYWDKLPVWLLHERVIQLIRGTPYGAAQIPSLWIGDLTTLNVDVAFSEL